MKYLIFGKGYMGHKFAAFLGTEAKISEVRLENLSDIKAELGREKPDVVINCAGKTGRPNVDWCEDHKMETVASNITAPLLLARAAEELGIYMAHVGSGCVYEGYKDGEGFSEDDPPNFDGSFYSKTKAWSETVLKEFPVLQLRIRMPFDSEPGERNFVSKITKYPKVISVPNSLTVLDDFFVAAKKLMDQKATGIFNLTNPGVIEHREILDMYKEIVDPNFHYELFSVEEMNKITKARRSNCALSTKKLESRGIRMRPIREAVRDALGKYRVHLMEGTAA